ncbi:MAG: iron chaperone [Spirosomataceae bacterium]
MNSTNPTFTNIDEYIAGFSEEIQVLLQSMRQTIREAAPEANEKISYMMPTFDLHGNLVHFAAYKNHIGFYPAPSGIKEFEEELKPYIAGKGSLNFPLNKPLPLDLVSRITRFRVTQNIEKAIISKKKKPKTEK